MKTFAISWTKTALAVLLCGGVLIGLSACKGVEPPDQSVSVPVSYLEKQIEALAEELVTRIKDHLGTDESSGIELIRLSRSVLELKFKRTIYDSLRQYLSQKGINEKYSLIYVEPSKLKRKLGGVVEWNEALKRLLVEKHVDIAITCMFYLEKTGKSYEMICDAKGTRDDASIASASKAIPRPGFDIPSPELSSGFPWGKAIVVVGILGGGAAVALSQSGDSTGNNQMTINPPVGPELVISSRRVSDNNVYTGESFTVFATVHNQGSSSASSTTLRYYRSSDATIDGTDAQIGTDSMSELAASVTSPEHSTLTTAPASAGTYYYGACVDEVSGESNTNNNCSAGVQVWVNPFSIPVPLPDLVVQSLSVSDNTLTPGQSFVLSATVHNQGAGVASSTTLRYYLSTDSTIDSSDTGVDTDSVPSLGASGSSPQNINLTAPPSAGTYYYGACVDSVFSESNTTNNCSAGVEVTVTVPQAPDLEVQSPSVDDSTLTTGQSFVLSATVHNQGTSTASSTTLRYYISTDSTISSSDTPVGTDPVDPLGVSGSSPESISLTAPSSAGTYYYGACIDEVSGESDTTNNCSTGVEVTVTVPQAPDLEVQSPSVDDSTLTTGQSFVLSTTVRNQGTSTASSTTLRYYISTDSTISSSDTPVGSDPVDPLGVSGSSPESISLTAPSSAGTYYYGACIDEVSGESDTTTTNNCSTGVEVTVTVPSALDLVISSRRVSDSNVNTGESFTVYATVRNQGNGAASATTLRYYLSSDATIDPSGDTPIGTDSISVLAASATGSEQSTLTTAPSSAGTYYYYACVDSVSGESDTTNNCSAGVEVTVTVPSAPDLVISSRRVSDSNVNTGESFTVYATVRNQGNGAASLTALRYYQSSDATIDPSGDTPIGTDSISVLAASATGSEQSTLTTAPSSAGTYYYYACVDSVSGESDTTNNCSAGVEVTVTVPSAPDLVISSRRVSDSNVNTGESFTVYATVRNQGNGAASATTLRYYLSSDATIDPSGDTPIGTDSISVLAASATGSEQSTLTTTPSSAGTYYYYACVDSVGNESDTTNNCSTGVEVTVTVPMAPDLVVQMLTVNVNSQYTQGDIGLGATIRNQGNTAASSATIGFYRSTSSINFANATLEREDSVNSGSLVVPGTSGNGTTIRTPSLSGTYYYRACVGNVSGEINTDNNCSNVVQVQVLARPDLVVQTPTVNPSTLDKNDIFNMSIVVSNQGSGAARPITLRYYRSTNSNISNSGDLEGTVQLSTPPTSASIPITAPSSAGTYYYGACVDSISGESDTNNNCSIGVPVTVLGQPDLVVQTTVSDNTVGTGQTFTLYATVRNQGDGGAASTTLHYYRSNNANFSNTATPQGTDEVSPLPALDSSHESIVLTAPPSTGTYYYGACVDSVSGESNISNNCPPGIRVTVETAAPDLIVEDMQASYNYFSGYGFGATVRNTGNTSSAQTSLYFYSSTSYGYSGSFLVNKTIPSLSPNQTSRQTHSASSISGSYIYACVNVVSGESNINNNCSSIVSCTAIPGNPNSLNCN